MQRRCLKFHHITNMVDKICTARQNLYLQHKVFCLLFHFHGKFFVNTLPREIQHSRRTSLFPAFWAPSTLNPLWPIVRALFWLKREEEAQHVMLVLLRTADSAPRQMTRQHMKRKWYYNKSNCGLSLIFFFSKKSPR